VLVCKKDFYIPSHAVLEIPNLGFDFVVQFFFNFLTPPFPLEVMMLMKSLKSRGYVKELFNWRHLYYFLTEEGVEYLREYLHLPPSVIPATHKVEEMVDDMVDEMVILIFIFKINT